MAAAENSNLIQVIRQREMGRREDILCTPLLSQLPRLLLFASIIM
jgi:hypothetical protein